MKPELQIRSPKKKKNVKLHIACIRKLFLRCTSEDQLKIFFTSWVAGTAVIFRCVCLLDNTIDLYCHAISMHII